MHISTGVCNVHVHVVPFVFKHVFKVCASPAGVHVHRHSLCPSGEPSASSRWVSSAGRLPLPIAHRAPVGPAEGCFWWSACCKRSALYPSVRHWHIHAIMKMCFMYWKCHIVRVSCSSPGFSSPLLAFGTISSSFSAQSAISAQISSFFSAKIQAVV